VSAFSPIPCGPAYARNSAAAFDLLFRFPVAALGPIPCGPHCIQIPVVDLDPIPGTRFLSDSF